MASAKMGKELFVVTANKVGMLAEVTGAVADAGVNIRSICAYAVEDKANFRMVTEDNAKASGALTAKGYEVKENDVVLVGLENKVGVAKELSAKLKEASIDLKYVYGTVCDCACECTIVLAADNNQKILEVLQ